MIQRIIYLVVVLGGIVGGGLFFLENINYKKFLDGEFVIPIGMQAQKDPAAEKILLETVNTVEGPIITRLTIGQAMGEIPAVSERQAQYLSDVKENYKVYQQLMDLCEQTYNTEANLTSVLIFARACLSWSVKSKDQVVTALSILRNDFSQTWQARMAPLIEATYLMQDRDSKTAEASYLEAIQMLEENLPTQGLTLDKQDPQLMALHKIYQFELPLRASYLVAQAKAQFKLGTYPRLNMYYLAAADATCRKVMAEFPNTVQFRWALDLSQKLGPFLNKEEEKKEESFEEKMGEPQRVLPSPSDSM